MASTINASTSPAAIVQTADGTGILSLQTAGTTAVTIDASQRAAFVAGTAALPAITTTGDTNTGMWFPAADTIAFSEGGAEAMRIDSSGNVGIGTSSPSTSNTAGASFVPGTSTVASMTGSNGSGQLLLGNNGNGSNLATNDSCGTIVFKGRFNSTFSGGNDIASIIGTYTGNGTTRSGAIRFLTLDSGTEAERMRITSAGDLLIGVASGYTSRLTVQGTAAAASCDVGVGANGNNGFSFRNASNSYVGSITVNASSTAYNTSSDYRLKENIVPMTGALAKVALLKPVTYKWKVDGSNGEGFIAHELQEVKPDCVTGEKDAVETYTDEDGIEQTRPKYQGIDTSFLVATLTAAIQEQQALITSLTARITALEGA